MVFTIHSKDDTIGREKIKEILKSKNIKTDLMNTMEFDCLTTDITQIVDYCYTTPFFASHKVVILKNPVFLLSEKSKVDFDDFIVQLVNYIENENEQTIMFIYSLTTKLDDKLDERKKIVKYLKENTVFKSVDLPSNLEIKNIIRNRVEKYHAVIDQDAIDLLLEKFGSNMNLVNLSNEIDKLIMFKQNDVIKKADVKDFVTCTVESSIFDLSNAILKKDIVTSLNLFEDLIANGEEPIKLISILATQFRIALITKGYQLEGLDYKSIGKKIRIHPYRVELASKLNFSNEDLENNLLKLANLDYMIKIGKVNKHYGTKLFILSI